jgi:uncharacterized membrane protein YjgN (DUF898 family)
MNSTEVFTEGLSDQESVAFTSEPNKTVIQNFYFHGSGYEYFRIWIVNLLLTLVTLGIYSAWAKVRRMQYFYENTELMGARFGYHADPKKVLKGRLLAILAVGGFYAAAYFFPAIEPFGSVIWVALLPALLALALYFRLRNTSYRGLRFEFDGTFKQSYQALRLPLALSLIGLAAVAVAMQFLGESGKPGMLIGIVLAVVYLLLPIIVMPMFQVQWKRFAHQHSLFGSERFGFSATVKQYTKTYLISFLVFFLLAIPIAFVFGMLMAFLFKGEIHSEATFSIWAKLPEILMGIAVVYVLLFAIAPYLKAKFFNLAWNNTQIGQHSFVADVPVWGLVGVSASNFALILLTLGFYRPFAVIRTQKYLLAHLHLNTAGEPADIFKTSNTGGANTVSEGALDLFGDMDM